MTLAEFKAWFEGYTESMDSTPSEKQWARIKARVKEIDGTPVTPIVIRDYWPTPRRYGRDYWYSHQDRADAHRTYLGNGTGKSNMMCAPAYSATWVSDGEGEGALYVNGEKMNYTNTAMYALGKADAESEAE